MTTANQPPFQALCETTGRVMLGLYFLLPGGLMKIFNYQGTADYMASHGMTFIPFFLILTIIIQNTPCQLTPIETRKPAKSAAIAPPN